MSTPPGSTTQGNPRPGTIPRPRTAVTIPHGDPLMHRTATQYRRLITQRDAIDQVLAQHSDTLRRGMTERGRTRLLLAGMEITKTGNTITVSIIDR